MTSKIAAGTEVEFREFPAITREQLKLYAKASGDFNPIHQDDEVAKKMGLPGVIAHGMLTAGLMAERAVAFAREEVALSGAELIRFSTRFKAMTFPGDVVSIGGRVKSFDAGSMTVELTARKSTGEVTTTGEAEFRV